MEKLTKPAWRVACVLALVPVICAAEPRYADQNFESLSGRSHLGEGFAVPFDRPDNSRSWERGIGGLDSDDRPWRAPERNPGHGGLLGPEDGDWHWRDHGHVGAIPEPDSLLLALGGVAVLLLWRRRRRRS